MRSESCVFLCEKRVRLFHDLQSMLSELNITDIDDITWAVSCMPDGNRVPPISLISWFKVYRDLRSINDTSGGGAGDIKRLSALV